MYKRIALIALLVFAFSMVFVLARSIHEAVVEEMEIDEASGLAASRKHPGIFYTHNDSGGKSIVYTLNSSGLMPAKLLLEGIRNRDWEDIAVGVDPATGKSCVFVGEIGDNGARHRSVYVYRFEEPELTDTMIVIGKVDSIEIVYEDGARDAETLFIDPKTGDIIIVSKREEQVGVYRVKYPYSLSEQNIARKVASIPMSMVVAGDITADGKQILIKTYTGVYRYKRKGKEDIAKAFASKPKAMPYRIEPQGEAIAWDARGKGYLTLSERAQDKPLILYYYK